MNPRILSTRAHGMLDMVVAPSLPIVARIVGCNRTVRRLIDRMALVASANTISTDFEAGLIHKLPVKAHLAIDGGSAAVLLGAAAMCHGRKRDRAVLSAAGVYFLATSILSETESSSERQRRAKRRQRAMAGHQIDTPMEEFATDARPDAATQELIR